MYPLKTATFNSRYCYNFSATTAAVAVVAAASAGLFALFFPCKRVWCSRYYFESKSAVVLIRHESVHSLARLFRCFFATHFFSQTKQLEFYFEQILLSNLLTEHGANRTPFILFFVYKRWAHCRNRHIKMWKKNNTFAIVLMLYGANGVWLLQQQQ